MDNTPICVKIINIMLSVKVFQGFEGRGRERGKGLNELGGQESW